MNQVTVKAPTGALAPSRLFAPLPRNNEDLMEGVAVSFPILSIANSRWTVRWKGEERVVTVPGHDDIPAPYIDVVLVAAQKNMSRVYYKDPYSGERNKPDCWASNGIKPDDEVPEPINPICGTCPMSAWGSGGTPVAPKAQACQQRRRTVVVPYSHDLTNEAEGGPMLLSVPPGSITNQRQYGAILNDLEYEGGKGVRYDAIVTRLAFEQKDLKGQPLRYPKIKFDYLKDKEQRPIFVTDEEAQVIIDLAQGEAVANILNSKMNIDGGEVEGADAPQGQSQVQPPKPATTSAATVKAPAAKPAPAPAPAAKPSPAAKPVGGHAVSAGTINEAVAKPAAPPPSVRTLAPAVDDDDVEARTAVEGAEDAFDELMARKL